MTKNYKLINNILGWLIGIFASAVYIMTAEPTGSWWDCGEYVSTGFKLLVGHPPGAPTFQLIARIFSMFAGGDVTKVAFCVNCMSAICSGLTIMFLFWTITMLGRKLVAKSGELTTGKALAIFGSALVGGLTYTFSDTFWFSAVEGEVYAMSSFFTALVFWCILKWDFEYDNPKPDTNPNRWIVLIAYLIGLSIGVHLLNLLTIPAVVLIVYFKLSKKASVYGVALTVCILSFFAAFFFPVLAMLAIWAFITIPLAVVCYKHDTFRSGAEWGVLLALGGAFVIVGLVLWGIIPMIVSLAGHFEQFFVNTFGLPFNSGTFIFFALVAALIFTGLWFGYKRRKQLLLAGTYCLLFLLIGYSTFFILVIRSNANPTIDENNPEDAVSLLAYLNRDQYGKTPFLYGPTYHSRVIKMENKGKVFVKDEKMGKYIPIADKEEPKYHPGDMRFMPRMYDGDEKHTKTYAEWTYPGDEKAGEKMLRRHPNYQENIRFMHRYQFGYMYLRYFMWNFSGRQNDTQGMGGELDGNWITGIPFIDKAFLGEQPEGIASMASKGTNKYYMLPLLLGLIGAIFYTMRDTKNSFIVFLLFLMTGLAISFYLNMYAFQPRERDYAFAASFYAFSIWVGFGVYAIYSLFEKVKNKGVQILAPVLITLICTGLVPCLMASQNWDDHDRSNRYTALATAKAYLDSCAPNAIIFTMGDNDTFPLWYAQEVEGYRTDVRVCNLSLLNAGWYVDQMKRKAYESEPLPISMTWDQYHDGVRDMIIFQQANASSTPTDIKQVMELIKDPSLNSKKIIASTQSINAGLQANGYNVGAIAQDITNRFYLTVDKEKVLKNGTVTPENSRAIVDSLVWISKGTQISRAFLIMMDILATNDWNRPIYFAKTTDEFFGLDDYLQDEGFAYRLVPMIRKKNADTDILYHHVMDVFDNHQRADKVKNPNAKDTPYEYQWGGLNDPRVYNCEDNIRVCVTIQGMHQTLAKQLIAEYQRDTTLPAKDRIYKLQHAEAVLDHQQKLMPDNLIPYKNVHYPYYTVRNIALADLYDAIREADTEHLLDDAALEQKAQKVREIIVGHIRAELEFYEKTDEKTRKFHEENLTLIYEQFLPTLADKCDLKSLPMQKTASTFCDNAERKLGQYMGSLESMINNYSSTISEINNDAQLTQEQKIARRTDFDNNIQKLYNEFGQELASFDRIAAVLAKGKDQALAQRAMRISATFNERSRILTGK